MHYMQFLCNFYTFFMNMRGIRDIADIRYIRNYLRIRENPWISVICGRYPDVIGEYPYSQRI